MFYKHACIKRDGLGAFSKRPEHNYGAFIALHDDALLKTSRTEFEGPRRDAAFKCKSEN